MRTKSIDSLPNPAKKKRFLEGLNEPLFSKNMECLESSQGYLLLILATISCTAFLVSHPLWQKSLTSDRPTAIEHDEGSIFTVGQLIVDGYAPYGEVVRYDKPPGLPLIAASAFSIGLDWRYLVLLTILIASVNLMLVGYIAYELYGMRTAIISSVLLALDPLALHYGHIVSFETWSNLFSLIAIWLMLLSLKNGRFVRTKAVAAGSAAALSCLTLQSAVILPFVFLFALPQIRVSLQWKRVARQVVLLALGSGIILGPFTVYLTATGTLESFIDAIFLVGSQSLVSEGVLIQFLKQAPFALVNGYSYNKLGWFLAVLFLIYAAYNLCSLRRTSSISTIRSDLFVMAWFAAFYFVIASLKAQWPHHIVLVSPVMAIMGARVSLVITYAVERRLLTFVTCIRQGLRLDWHRLLSLTLLSLLVVEIGVLAVDTSENVIKVGFIAPSDWYGDHNSQVKLARFVEANTLPNDRIIALFQPYLYYLAHRAPAVKYCFLGYEAIVAKQVPEVSTAIRNGEAAVVIVTDRNREGYILDLLKNSPIYYEVKMPFCLWNTSLDFPYGAVFLRFDRPSRVE